MKLICRDDKFLIDLHFSGWFQCRLATDPDRYDEPVGEKGSTFALPGEPNLDRIIRFQDPVSPRSHAPTVGVFVNKVEVNGEAIECGILRAKVELLEGALFEGRNGEVAAPSYEPIVPYHLRISNGSFEVHVTDPINLGDPEELKRRQPVRHAPHSSEVAAATGIADPKQYRQERLALLKKELDETLDNVKREGLMKRIDNLKLTGENEEFGEYMLQLEQDYEFDLRGPNSWIDHDGLISTSPNSTSTWKATFWMGGWDADALTGYTLGKISIL